MLRARTSSKGQAKCGRASNCRSPGHLSVSLWLWCFTTDRGTAAEAVTVDRARSGLTNSFDLWDDFPKLQGLATDMPKVMEQVMGVCRCLEVHLWRSQP